MKKIIISLFILNIFMTSVNAETYTGNHSISLSYSYLPSYSVKIPKKINISNNTTYFNYYVSGDIYYDSSLQVLFDSQTNIYNNNASIKVYCSQEKTIWNYEELSNSYSQSSACLSHDSLDSGTWYGELNVVISLVGGA